MAIMIPNVPRRFDAKSLEGLVFDSLSQLPDEYYVIHSFQSTYVEDNVLKESETDFIVFNPKLGILCVEAKAGHIQYKGGEWLYGSGDHMKNGGPYIQASDNKYNMLHVIENSNLKLLLKRCKLLHAVWFPSVHRRELENKVLSPEADMNITLTLDDLENPLDKIKKIFSIELPYNIKTNLSMSDTNRLIREIICPEFDIFPTKNLTNDLKHIVFHRLLNEQKRLLNYLVDQKTAIINGAAGTGKTMIALEKANRHAEAGEKVLFLCFNAYLKQDLEDKFKNDNIDFYTISGLVCKLCDSREADYDKACEILLDKFIRGRFEYKHIVIDEGQDFGIGVIERSGILKTLREIVLDLDGTFYMFYDQLQLIQSFELPECLKDADCKLTLYRNCRNTLNIEKTSLKPIVKKEPKIYPGDMDGVPTEIYFRNSEDSVIQFINEEISLLNNEGFDDVVILTCKTETESILHKVEKDGKVFGTRFTTCRKFKGLESDAVILTDITEELFNEHDILRFYVGASRARLKLILVSNMNDEECKRVLNEKLKIEKKIRNPRRNLARELNALEFIE